jgi:glycosyltransferase involved in cell wall biosynthesis
MGKNSDRELEKRIKAILGDFDPTVPPPKIAPVPEGVKRPTWSVMIPTFNCAKYLTQTLESVLEQDPGPEHMQIEVVDDCSTLDDPEKVVREVGKGRVAFHRNPKNSGYCTLNFNICIQRSIGHLVHILHGDDYVLPGFYNKILEMARCNLDCAFLAVRSFFVDEQDIISGLTDRVLELEQGGKAYTRFMNAATLQFAGVVFRRNFFETHGGFMPSLVHCADWEMWVRGIANCGAVVAPDILGSYRIFNGNDTSKLTLTGENLRDIARLILILNHFLPEYCLSKAFKKLSLLAHDQFLRFSQLENPKAQNHAEDVYKELNPEEKPRRDLAWLLFGISNAIRKKAEELRRKNSPQFS